MNIKTLFLSLALSSASVFGFAQDYKAFDSSGNEYKLTVVKKNPITSIKNQYRSGTCWSFSGISFLESEAIRINHIKDTALYPDFSEMFIVSNSYKERADKYIRLDGNLTWGAGSECEDVIHIMGDFGLVPNVIMPGLEYGTTLPVHGELDALTKAYVEAISKNPNKVLSTAWKKGFSAMIDAYLGKFPSKFTYKGKEYTPDSYRDSYKLNAEDYISFTSFSHHPFYKPFALEVADNWRNDKAYNLPIDEFINLWFSVVEKGYTTTWGGDVSEKGFSRNGLALMPEMKEQHTQGSDQERWVGKGDSKQSAHFETKEVNVTQAMRQEEYDNKNSTDDHGMHVFGIAKDQYGRRFFMVKNSWGETAGAFDGIWFISEEYCKAKALDFMVHKSAIPEQLRKKLGIK